MRARSLTLLMTTALVAGSSLASAAPRGAPEPKDPTGLTTTLSGEALEQWESGRKLYAGAASKEDYEAALAAFHKAHELRPDVPRLLFYVGVVERELARAVDSTRDLKEFLEKDPAAPAKQRDQATEVVKSLEPFLGTLRVQTDAAGAALTLDDRALGTTPITGEVMVAAGPHHLVASKAGFVTVDQQFEVAPRDTKILMISFVAEQPMVTITASDNAHLFLDGRLLPTSGGTYEGRITAGVHRLRAEAKGKQTYDHDITIESTTRTFPVTLQEEPHGGLPTWAWIAGGVVVAGGLATGGYFLFRPSDTAGATPAGNLSPNSVIAKGRATPIGLTFH